MDLIMALGVEVPLKCRRGDGGGWVVFLRRGDGGCDRCRSCGDAWECAGLGLLEEEACILILMRFRADNPELFAGLAGDFKCGTILVYWSWRGMLLIDQRSL